MKHNSFEMAREQIEWIYDKTEDIFTHLDDNSINFINLSYEEKELISKVVLQTLQKNIPNAPAFYDDDFKWFICDDCDFFSYQPNKKKEHRYCVNCGQIVQLNNKSCKNEKM
jgi:hypothetical protein